jgi:hypothetical protein
VSGNLGSLTGLLSPVTSSRQENLGQLPYQVSESNQLLNTTGLLILEKDVKSANDIVVDGNNSGQSVCQYELSSNSLIETCRKADSINVRQELLEENIHGIKSLLTCPVHDNANGRTVWHSDNKQSFHNHEGYKSENTDILCSLSYESANCNNRSKDANVQESDMQNSKRSCGKKKDYEKLAPFKFFCTLCSFKSKRESHYQRHLELHSKVSNSIRLITVK